MTNQATQTEKRIVESASKKTVKRAQWEAFSFNLEAPGIVRVTNGSHENPEDHSHKVTIKDGIPTECECKADKYHEGPCKHRVAIAIREPILAACEASKDEQDDRLTVEVGSKPATTVATDGGEVEILEPETRDESDEESHADGCDNPECEGYDADGRPLLSFECWREWA